MKLLDEILQFPTDKTCAVEFRVGQDDGQFISTCPADDIDLSCRVLDQLCDSLEHTVSNEVSEGVIYPPQVVYASNQQTHWYLVPLGSCCFQAKQFPEVSGVVCPGERVPS